MNIFEFSDHDGDTLSVDEGDGQILVTAIQHRTPLEVVSVTLSEDAARALIKALRAALPPEETEQAAPVPRFIPKSEGYFREAAELLDEKFSEYRPSDVLDLARFLAGELR